MSKRESISRYNLIIKKLRRNPASFSEIEDYLSRESEIQAYNFTTTIRTFQRDLNDIRSLFNIDIKYNSSRKVYEINEDDEPDVNMRILEAFDTFNALNVSDRLSKYIHFEKRRPQGTENLYDLLHAIKNHLQIKFTYQKYWEDEPEKRTIKPLALKEFKNRWYVMGNDLDHPELKSFAIDRLSGLQITKKTFKYPKDFDIDQSYKYCFGIIRPTDQKEQNILLSLDPIQGKYIKSLPLHESQEIILENDEELQVRLTLCITFDFIMELLSYGGYVEVLGPKSLVKDVKRAHKEALNQYK
jgi:predicted DNA-binding transcriptional regulator YafY